MLTGNIPEILGLLGYGYGMAGMKREAQDVLKELNNLARQNTYVSSFSRATIHIGLGETDPAFKWLEQAYQDRLWDSTLLAVDPLFDRLRGRRAIHRLGEADESHAGRLNGKRHPSPRGGAVSRVDTRQPADPLRGRGRRLN